ncbi:MAG: peptidase C15 [Prochlorothrix sp.]
MASFLLTSFDIWLTHHTHNSSDQVLGLLVQQQRLPADCQLLRCLPVEIEGAFGAVQAAIEQFQPDFVICCGMAEGRSSLDLEQQAIDCPIQASAENPSADDGMAGNPHPRRDWGQNARQNSSHTPRSEDFQENPRVLQTQINLVSLIPDLTQTCISTDAGRFVCNGLYFRVLDWIDRHRSASQALFIHVPCITPDNEAAIVADFGTLLDRLNA